MKEDILEQLVDDYLQSKGYFTRHNIKFLPSKKHPDFNCKKDSNHSDIDVIGINPMKANADRVWVVSCKSWQSGFRVKTKLNELAHNKICSGREAWQGFRELMRPKWSDAFVRTVEDATGSSQFTYVTAVTAVVGDKQLWETHQPFRKAMRDNPLRLICLQEMLDHLEAMSSTTVASSDIGRILQLIKAAKKGKTALLEAVGAQIAS